MSWGAFTADGGKGSGNFGHAGRPGKVGGSASFSSTAEAIAYVEDNIREDALETAFAVDGNGNIVFNRSDDAEDYVIIPDEDKPKLKNAVFTHNHPRGTTFSGMDLSAAYDGMIKEIRACSKDITYSLKRQFSVKQAIPSHYANFANDYTAAVKHYNESVTDPLWDKGPKTQALADKLNNMVETYKREWLKGNAKSYGWKYTEETK